MIHYTSESSLKNQLFKTPFDQHLNMENRWVVLEGMIPWDELSNVLMDSMEHNGRRSVDLRHVLGALLIKGMENLSDEDTLQQIEENIYMQYFVGLRSLAQSQLFTPEVLVSVRKRLGEEGMSRINEVIIKHAQSQNMIQHRKSKGKESTHKGTLKVDATVCPQQIKYPTDTALLIKAREFTERMVDLLYEQGLYGDKKPRTYRKVAAKYALDFSKKRKPNAAQVKKAKRQQLQYIRRNFKHINQGLDTYAELHEGSLPPMNKKTYKTFLVVQVLYSQQDEMYRDGRKRVDDRIISIDQPHIRPIVRNKAGKKVEFGPKVNMSETEGFVKMEKISFDNFNEAKDLGEIVCSYKGQFGYFPESVLIDKIFLNRENRKMLKELGIQHYGSPLGKPPKMSVEEKRKRKKKQNKRSEIEGKFGIAKLKYGMGCIKMRLAETSKAMIGLIAISMNIWQMWRKNGHFWSKISFDESIFGILSTICFQFWTQGMPANRHRAFQI